MSNSSISPIYQSIRTLSEGGVPDGDPNANIIEPILAWIFTLMDAYRSKPSSPDDAG